MRTELARDMTEEGMGLREASAVLHTDLKLLGAGLPKKRIRLELGSGVFLGGSQEKDLEMMQVGENM